LITYFDQMGIVVGRFDFESDGLNIPYNTLCFANMFINFFRSGHFQSFDF